MSYSAIDKMVCDTLVLQVWLYYTGWKVYNCFSGQPIERKTIKSHWQHVVLKYKIVSYLLSTYKNKTDMLNKEKQKLKYMHVHTAT